MSSGHATHHLPGMEDVGDLPVHEGRTRAGRPFGAPKLGAERAREVAAAVRSAALRARRERPTERVVETVARAAGRLADPDDEAGRRARALLASNLGWPGELVDETLEGMGCVWSEAALRAVIEEEVGDPSLLGGYGPEESVSGPAAGAVPGGVGARRRRAAGPPLLLVVHAANVPGVAVTAAIRGLLVRSGVLSKSPEAEPGLLPLFARALAEEDPLLGDSVAATWWPGSSGAPVGDAWAGAAGELVVYGGDEAVREVRATAPAGAGVLAYGPKLGVGVVLPDAAGGRPPWPGRLARDVCAYEQQGCVSPRAVYVMGGDALPFAEALGEALEEEVDRIARPAPTREEAVALRSLRVGAEFRGYADGRGGVGADEGSGVDGPPAVLAGGGEAGWTILVERAAPPESEGLPRLVRVHPVRDAGRLAQLLAPAEGRLQAVGYAGRRGLPEVADLGAELGASRVAPFGTVAWPPADWRHDGRHRLLPLLRWTDWELASREP